MSELESLMIRAADLNVCKQPVEQLVAGTTQEVRPTHTAFLQILMRQEKSGQGLHATDEQIRATERGPGQLATQALHLVFHLLLGVLQSIKQGRIKLFDIALKTG